MKGRKINDVTRLHLKRVIFIAVLSLSLSGFPAGNDLLAQDDISDRNELLSRIKILRKNFAAASKKFQALRKRYEFLFKETQAIERRIEQEKQRIVRIRARRSQEQAKRAAKKLALEESLMRKSREDTEQQYARDKTKNQAQRRKVIEQLLRELETQKRQ